ncbi:MAG: tail fiber assembly protein [Enterobacteriaceae bacterium]|nr:tail fiber assembly protein [Enterobacteriaceae bacterium]
MNKDNQKIQWAFSPSEGAFYYYGIKDLCEMAGSWPADATDIPDEIRNLFITPPEGKVIGSVDGFPAWVDAPSPTHEVSVDAAEYTKKSLRAVADSEITVLQDSVDLGLATDDELLKLVAWKKYRILLNSIDTAFAPDIEWPVCPEM